MKISSMKLFVTRSFKVACVCGVFSLTSCGASRSNRHENFIVQTIVRNVQVESEGKPHYTSHESWNAYWIWRIRNMRKAPEGDRYEKMVIDSRRSAGLPELKY